MATVYLTTPAVEGSTFTIPFSILDDNGNTVVPTMAQWTLWDSTGMLVNNRIDQSVPVLAASMEIALAPQDLVVGPVDSGYRIVTVEGRYPAASGPDKDFRSEIVFSVEKNRGG